MFRIAVVLLFAVQSFAQSAPPDEIATALAHSEALYYAARFSDSIALLTRVDGALATESARRQDKVNAKLWLALAHVGTNDLEKAKRFLGELYALDPEFVLDPDQFSKKVIALAAEAKADQSKVRCQAAAVNARTFFEKGETASLLATVREFRPKCDGVTLIGPEAADAFYRAGVGAYKRAEFSQALSSFEAVMTLSPDHPLAVEYIELTRERVALTTAREKPTPTPEVKPAPEVKKEEPPPVAVALAVAPAPEVKREPVGCFEMQTQLALARLKSRVDPSLPGDARIYFKNATQITVNVKARISETGDVTVMGMQDGNPLLNTVVRNAVSQWKFSVIRDASGPRCVDTEIPLVIKRGV